VTQDDPSSPDLGTLTAEPAAGTVDRGRTAGDEELEDDVEQPPNRARSLIEWGLVIAGALLVALIIKTFLFQAFYIPSASMEPTLNIGDRVLVNKLSYRLHDVNRGDLVVFERPENEQASNIKDLIKRVVATEGETIEARDGDVLIDGKPLEEPYLADGITTDNLERQTVPEDHVFVMGDNRVDSRDSRVFGPIDEDLIVGRAFIRVWPPSDIGFL
jgi:signal peptidase I